MKEVVKITSVLTTVCLICAFLLSFVYGLAHEKIALNAKKRVEDAISILAPEAKEIKKIISEGEEIYKLFDAKGSLFAYAFLAEGQGYQGKIKMLVVSDSSLEYLKGIEVVESLETPGLGAKIQDAPFKKQFKDLKIKKEMTCVKGEAEDEGQIKAITGATVSSRAVVNILNKRLKQLKNLLKPGFNSSEPNKIK